MIKLNIKEEEICLKTDGSLFSPGAADRGTLAMLSCVEFSPGERVLDLGCGYGLVGLLAARKCGEENVWMADIDPVAVGVAQENAKNNGVGGVHVVCSDGFSAIEEAGFDLILSNPPYQSDFRIAKMFIEKGFNRLKLGGRLFMVTKRKAWYRNKLIHVFGGVVINEVDGYFVFEAQRRQLQYAFARPKHT